MTRIPPAHAIAGLLAAAVACADEQPRSVGSGSWGADAGDVGESGEPAGDGGDGDLECDGVELVALTVLEEYCLACHAAGDEAVPGFDDFDDVERLVTEGKLVPGAAEQSPLFLAAADGTMPPPSAEAPDEGGIAALQLWIDHCLHPVECQPEHAIGRDGMLELVRADLAALPPDDREFLRYFSLAHLFDAGDCGAGLDEPRRALAKAANSLSWAPALVVPTPIDPDRTIYRIDMRDYDWDAAVWDAIVAESPYAIAHAGDAAADVQAFTGTAVPIVRGDWFAAMATAPPLYHEILQLPGTRQALEAALGVDVEADIAADEVERAGFLESGVAQNNRLIERHTIPGANNRAYWTSYDFASSAGTANVFSHPLDFEAPLRMHMFTLPNGLSAYLVTDGIGLRLDRAPEHVVTDPQEPDQNVVNGRSCMRCHGGGVIVRDDELRAYAQTSAELDDATKEKIERLHPPAAVLRATQELDAERHAAALLGAGVPPSADEPIGAAYARYVEDVDLAAAAAEMGIAADQLVVEIGTLAPALQPLAFGTVARQTFAQEYAEAACALNLGTTRACGLGEPQ